MWEKGEKGKGERIERKEKKDWGREGRKGGKKKMKEEWTCADWIVCFPRFISYAHPGVMVFGWRALGI